ncbi:MAG: ATP:cob(I)alamin adenosyltransferase [Bacteroidetes bacterium HGW-Bacteroidetes-1]|jgi:cob(I)alamin adenosyltransferase|nr:MAG: ATP:cob(I)alamin adenosyltransferase [Bacteroidetes bacterium HGW-Bacteroidetes-1]
MKIYTKTGDSGKTSLIGGTRVPKYHDRIEAYGTVDELNAFVGLIRDHIEVSDPKRKILLEIQEKLFRLESHLAEDSEGVLTRMMPQLNEKDVEFLEHEMDAMNELLPELTNFILPGGHIVVSYCHIARTVCRRAERISTRLHERFHVSEIDLKYLNRLSDYFFVLGRYYSMVTKSPEVLWKP